MAESCSEYIGSRNSFMSTEIQGHLEKKGVLGNKSKLWCSVQLSTLRMQKKQGEPVKTIDLKGCHQVRKVTSDLTGTQFEIYEKKKSHVFICPSSENCTTWVKTLQAAMALKDSGHFSSDEVTDTPDESPGGAALYEVCRWSLPQKSTEESAKICEYTEPCDDKNATHRISKENVYWEVEDGKVKTDKPLQIPQSINDGRSSNSASNQNQAEQKCEDAESQAATARQSSAHTNSPAQAVKESPRPASQKLHSKSLDVPRYSQEFPEISQEAPLTVLRTSTHRKDSCNNEVFSNEFDIKSTDSADSSREVSYTDEDDSPFQVLFDALSDNSSPIPDFINPLTDEDWKPVEDLTEFLNSNLELFQVSYPSIPFSDDPVNSLKSYLENIDDITTKSRHS